MMVGVSTAARAMVTFPACTWPGNNGANLPWSPEVKANLVNKIQKCPFDGQECFQYS